MKRKNPKSILLGRQAQELPLKQIHRRGELYVRPVLTLYAHLTGGVAATQRFDNTFDTRDTSILNLSREGNLDYGHCNSVGKTKNNVLLDGRPQGSPLQVDHETRCPTVGAGLVPALTRQSPSHNALQNAGISETALMFGAPTPSQLRVQEYVKKDLIFNGSR
jgi:hypothetical protein